MSAQPLVLENFSVALGERLLFDIEYFAPEPGSSTAIVGKTGSGKSVLLRALSGLCPQALLCRRLHEPPRPRRLPGGRKTSRDTWRAIMASGLVYVPESAQSLNPALTIEQNQRLLAPEAGQARRAPPAGALPHRVRPLRPPVYPDEMSGGELQRITIYSLGAQGRPGVI
jgi:ABC-type glutathione transport system ATPase component